MRKKTKKKKIKNPRKQPSKEVLSSNYGCKFLTQVKPLEMVTCPQPSAVTFASLVTSGAVPAKPLW